MIPDMCNIAVHRCWCSVEFSLFEIDYKRAAVALGQDACILLQGSKQQAQQMHRKVLCFAMRKSCTVADRILEFP